MCACLIARAQLGGMQTTTAHAQLAALGHLEELKLTGTTKPGCV